MQLVLQIQIILVKKNDDWIQVLDLDADQDHSPPIHVLIPFDQYGHPKKSAQIIFLQHF